MGIKVNVKKFSRSKAIDTEQQPEPIETNNDIIQDEEDFNNNVCFKDFIYVMCKIYLFCTSNEGKFDKILCFYDSDKEDNIYDEE